MNLTLGKFSISWGGNSFFTRRQNILLGQTGPVWIEVDKPRELYEQIPQLYNPINKLAAMFSNAIIVMEDEEGNDIGTDEFKALMANPNFDQSMNQWLSMHVIHESVYGNAYMYKNTTAFKDMPVALWNISPKYISPIMTGKTFDQVELKGVISGYKYCEAGKEKTYETEFILYTKIADIDNPFIGRSPLISLRFPLTNTKLAYEYRNVIMGRRGAIGMLSPESSKDGMGGAIPLTPDERLRIQKEHVKNYGVRDGQSPLLMSEAPLRWTPMTYPTKELMLFEEIDANQMTILDTYGINRNIYKDSSFENQKSGMIQTYQDTVFPMADLFGQNLTRFLGPKASKNGKGTIKLKYDHLIILQQDKDKEIDVLKKQIEAVVQLYEKNLVNKLGAIQMLISISGIKINDPDPETTIDILNRMSPLVANNVIQQLLIDEIRALLMKPSIPGGNERPSQGGGFGNQPPAEPTA